MTIETMSSPLGPPKGTVPVRRPLLDAETLPGHLYASDDVFAEEHERIFSKMWCCVGREEDVAEPGDVLRVEIGAESIIVARGADGRVRAFYNVCRHRGAQLITEASCRGLKHLVCPYHAWGYGLDGRLEKAPLMGEGRNGSFCREDLPLVSVRLETWLGFLFLNLDDDAPSHAEQIAEFPDVERFKTAELRRAARVEYDVDANWKLLAENYGECYHCAVAHPQLQRVSDFRSGGLSLHGGAFTGGPMTIKDGFNTLSLSGVTERRPIPGLEAEDHETVHYFNLYPNFLLSLHPDYVMTHTVWPRSAERTRVVCEWLFTPEAMARDGFDPNDAVEFWDLTNRQDWELCERTQRGTRSRGYRRGPYQSAEVSVYNFDTWYLDRMGLRSRAETEVAR